MLSLPKSRYLTILYTLLALFLFTRSLNVHGLEYRDDEIFYFNSTKQMVEINEYMSPVYFDKNRFQKPILFYWFIIFFYKLFGINWMAARLTSAIFAALTVGCTWLLAARIFNRNIATLSAFILMTIVMFFRHAKNAVPDMTLNFFIVAALYVAYQIFEKHSSDNQESVSVNRQSLLFFVFCGLGFMIKGFAALIVPILTVIVFALLLRQRNLLKEFRFLRGCGIILLIVLPWFLYMINRHGMSYLEYMVVDETKNRLLGSQGGNIIVHRLTIFGKHILFYLKTILSYFAPWSIFGFLAIPYSLAHVKSDTQQGRALKFLLCWFFVVFFFFSFMDFAINHYVLVLTTPFAILTSFFFLNEKDSPPVVENFLNVIRKYVPIFFVILGTLAFLFLSIFLAGIHKWWGAVIVLVAGAVIVKMFVYKRKLMAPLSLGIFLFVIFCQSSMMEQAKITAHSTLGQFAKTIHADLTEGAVIAVGSRDIHEKEFQAHFDIRVDKVVTPNVEESKENLKALFEQDKNIYCLITQKDYEMYFEGVVLDQTAVIHEDYIFRKRMYLDQGFFKALITLDQETAYHYLMEKLILLRKKVHV